MKLFHFDPISKRIYQDKLFRFPLSFKTYLAKQTASIPTVFQNVSSKTNHVYFNCISKRIQPDEAFLLQRVFYEVYRTRTIITGAF